METPLISLSIVTYNNERIIEDTLDTLIAQWPVTGAMQVILVDNCSVDGTPRILQRRVAEHGSFEFVQNSANIGYGGGHNLAIRRVNSRYHVICNPDILLLPEVLDRLASFMASHPEVAMVSPRFRFPDGRLQPINHRLPTITDLFLRRFVPKPFRCRFQRRADYYVMLDVGYEQVCDVPFPSGAFMFCRTDVLQQIGGFDNGYFLYFEDVDLAQRVRQAGYRTAYCPDAEVIHLWARAAHTSWRLVWVFVCSAFRYFNKWGYRLY